MAPSEQSLNTWRRLTNGITYKLSNAEPSLIWWEVCSVSEQLLAIDYLSTFLPVKFSSRRLGAIHWYNISNRNWWMKHKLCPCYLTYRISPNTTYTKFFMGQKLRNDLQYSASWRTGWRSQKTGILNYTTVKIPKFVQNWLFQNF